ncbi:unnamed protein product, partial [Prunus brigantina]
MVESDWGKWAVKSPFGIVKHGGEGKMLDKTQPFPFMNRCPGREEVPFYDRDLLGTNIAPTSLDSSVAAWVEAEWIPRDGLSAFPRKSSPCPLQPFLTKETPLIPPPSQPVLMALAALLSSRHLLLQRAAMGQSHGATGIPFRFWGRLTFSPVRSWRKCNAADGDGRAWHDDFVLVMFVWLGSSVISRVAALASPSHLCAQTGGPG